MSEHAKTNLPRRPNVLLRLLGDVSFGIILLVLILLYASIGSGVAPLRGALEMTEMQVFQHWLFVLLIVLFGLALLFTFLVLAAQFESWIHPVTIFTGIILAVFGIVTGILFFIADRSEKIGYNGVTFLVLI